MEKGESGKVSTPSGVATLKLRKKRKMQAWQAYQAMTYESQWKAVIEVEWKAYCSEWAQSQHAEGEKAETLFNFRNKFMREKYNNETEEVKQQVEEFRLKAVGGAADNINAAYQG